MLALEYVREDGEVETVTITKTGTVCRHVPDYTSRKEMDSFTIQASVVNGRDERGGTWFTSIGLIRDETPRRDNSWTMMEKILRDPVDLYKKFEAKIDEVKGGA